MRFLPDLRDVDLVAESDGRSESAWGRTLPVTRNTRATGAFPTADLVVRRSKSWVPAKDGRSDLLADVESAASIMHTWFR